MEFPPDGCARPQGHISACQRKHEKWPPSRWKVVEENVAITVATQARKRASLLTTRTMLRGDIVDLVLAAKHGACRIARQISN